MYQKHQYRPCSLRASGNHTVSGKNATRELCWMKCNISPSRKTIDWWCPWASVEMKTNECFRQTSCLRNTNSSSRVSEGYVCVEVAGRFYLCCFLRGVLKLFRAGRKGRVRCPGDQGRQHMQHQLLRLSAGRAGEHAQLRSKVSIHRGLTLIVELQPFHTHFWTIVWWVALKVKGYWFLTVYECSFCLEEVSMVKKIPVHNNRLHPRSSSPSSQSYYQNIV